MNNIWKEYAAEVAKLEDEGMTTSDAQGVVDVRFMAQYGIGWESKAS